MAYQCHSYHGTYTKSAKHSSGSSDIRTLLAEFILNFEFPRDLYSILITGLVIYLSLKLFRFSIRLILSLIRPIIFFLLILIILPYIYEMKTGITSHRMVNNLYSHTEGFFSSIYNIIRSIYLHTIRFYANSFVH